ncbi:MAG: tetratricopeptide repeat protein, partial [Candidatus Sulfotelmatobacter sp.]
DTPRPSTQFRKRASTDREAASAAADVRSSDCKQLSKTLRGDLDWIAMKALEKDRARRYGTPFELSTDVSSYLDNEPVLAGPSTRGYRIRKYAVRHRIALSVAAGLLILLSGFVVAQAVALRRITQERDRATRITNFMTGIFKVSKPSEARGNTITAREILDKASVDINTGLTKDPELQAQMMFVMGDVYDNLGLYSRAQALQQKTVEIRRRTLGPENPETLKSMSALAVTLRKQGHFTEAETLQRQTLDAQRRVLGAEDPDTLRSMYNLGRILWGKGRYPEAEKLDRETLDIQRRVLGPEHPDTLTSISNLAADLRNEHRHPEAQKLFRETFDIRLRVLGPEHPDTLTSMSDLANILTDDGQYDEAVKLHREVLDTRRRVLGPEHPETLTSMNNLADTLVRMREYPEAEQLVKQAFDIQRRVLGPDSPDTALTTYNLACIASYRSEIDEAFSLLNYAVDHGLPPFADLFIVKDNDLKSLRGDPRFAPLVTHAEERAAAAQKGN